MLYLNSFNFPNRGMEHNFFMQVQRTCYDNFYPFQILTRNQLERLDFEPVTILYGGNGSGKSTALNVIAEKLGVTRDSNYNKSSFFPDYVKLCSCDINDEIPMDSRIIRSDDVFDYILNTRAINDGVDNKREEMFTDYLDTKYSKYKFESMEDYEALKKLNKTRRNTQSKYVRSELVENIREFSNGESAYIYFTEHIKENALYILDEPENSLSPLRQMELKQFIEESIRFFNCQFIISTHSPFLLSIKGAKVYNLDNNPVEVEKWTNLENVKVYYEFFEEFKSEF